MTEHREIHIGTVTGGAMAFGANSPIIGGVPMPAVTPSSRHLTASIVVVDPDAEAVLLVWHAATGAFVFPGGHLDVNEAPHETALREVIEETGITPTLVDIDAGGPLPGMVNLPVPWLVCEIPAPAKLARPGRAAEPAHTHIDCLYVGTADCRRRPVGEASGASRRPAWWPIDYLPATVRAEVPSLARAALAMVRHLQGGA